MTRLLILVSILLLSPLSSFAQNSEGKHRFSIEEIIKNEDSDFYSTEAYIIDIGLCPACVPNVLVAATLVENKENQLKLNINPIQHFEIGKRYLFLIQKKTIDGKTIREITDYHLIPEQLNGK
jgi:hypothetical protein